MSLDGSHITILAAFIAGFVTFFASCLLPLVPTYLAYLSGVALSSPDDTKPRGLIFRTALLFVLGFILTFMVLGLFTYQLAAGLTVYRFWLERAAGLLFILLGIFTLGIIKPGWFEKEHRLSFRNLFTKHRHLHALATGIGFGLGWTPCIGPVLAVILFWASRQATTWQGVGLLGIYGLGLGLPFILVALLFEQLTPWLKKSQVLSRGLGIASGLLMILAGVLFLTGHFAYLSMLLLQFFQLPHLSA